MYKSKRHFFNKMFRVVHNSYGYDVIPLLIRQCIIFLLLLWQRIVFLLLLERWSACMRTCTLIPLLQFFNTLLINLSLAVTLVTLFVALISEFQVVCTRSKNQVDQQKKILKSEYITLGIIMSIWTMQGMWSEVGFEPCHAIRQVTAFDCEKTGLINKLVVSPPKKKT